MEVDRQMSKNKNDATNFEVDRVVLLIDTSALVRIRNFSEAIPQYAQFFNLYTLERNRQELNYLNKNNNNALTFYYSIELIKQVQMGTIKIMKTRKLPRKFVRKIDQEFPRNNLSSTDKLLIFEASNIKDNVVLVTNDRELSRVAGKLGIATLGAFELYLLIKEEIQTVPKNVQELLPAIFEAKKSATAALSH